MPKTFESESVFPYPYLLSAKAIWNKYPNPFSTHVVSVDVLDQQLDLISGKLRTERILGVRQSAPKWAVKLLGSSEETYVREVVMIDPFSHKYEMTSTNLSLSEYLLVKEYITYKPFHGTPLLKGPPPHLPQAGIAGANSTDRDTLSSAHADPMACPSSGVTMFVQKAGIECNGLKGVLKSAANKVEEWSLRRFGDNAAKGRMGLLSVLESMYGAEAVGSGFAGFRAD
ncbi:MSF1-domain-containing protein [Violaceomyces palustris]|uniref:MSF1-domain-containing protein n=1 Tax=Violaceomyces palustris TaxID=1673888 RepID=A0ACD0P3N9_9BASI|nr:MSF1-domain-containing protein [Violaceomyces palustris]